MRRGWRQHAARRSGCAARRRACDGEKRMRRGWHQRAAADDPPRWRAECAVARGVEKGACVSQGCAAPCCACGVCGTLRHLHGAPCFPHGAHAACAGCFAVRMAHHVFRTACMSHGAHAACTGCFATCMACLPSERGCLSSAWRACRLHRMFRYLHGVPCPLYDAPPFCAPDRLLIMDWFHVLCMTRPPLARRSLSSAPSFRSSVHIFWRLSAAAVILRGTRA